MSLRCAPLILAPSAPSPMNLMRPLPRLAALLVVAAAVVTLAGCGTKTPLRLPPPEKPVASGTAAPAPLPAPAPADKGSGAY